MATETIGIAGAGIGGLTAAIALHKAGKKVVVFEQARQFSRVGADINLTPNAVRALDGIGIGADLRRDGARPTHRVSRTWDTGEVTSSLAMSTSAEEQYGAPQLTLHRADLLQSLEKALPAECIRLGKRVSTIEQVGDEIVLGFSDGTKDRVGLLIGADGIHSAVRAKLFGEEHPRFTGVVAYRAVVPAERLSLPGLDRFTKWWGPTPESQIVTFPISAGREIFIFATTPQESWRHESWTTPGSVDELRAEYAGYHAEVQVLLEACDEVLKTALYERDPLARWSNDRMTMLGDACHPMMPFMAQGAAMSIEDAVVLGRCLTEPADMQVPDRLRLYEALRLQRTSQIQVGSRGNNWLREGGNADWVYGYDAWGVPLQAAS